MYTPAHFAIDDETTRAFLAQIEAADLVTPTADGLIATFLPLLFDATRGAHGALLGHVARKNDHWRAEPTTDSLVIASWYATKREHGRVVPTWNYTTAHIYGRLHIHDDPAWVDDIVRRLTTRHEAHREHAWSVDDAPADFHGGQLRAIVGVELEITRVEAKFKLSQNRPAADIDGVVAGLTAEGDPASAALVERHRRPRQV